MLNWLSLTHTNHDYYLKYTRKGSISASIRYTVKSGDAGSRTPVRNGKPANIYMLSY